MSFDIRPSNELPSGLQNGGYILVALVGHIFAIHFLKA